MAFELIGLDAIGLDCIPSDRMDSIESNQNELEWTGLSAVHWMLFYHGLGEFPIVGFLQFEIPTCDILPLRFG